LGIELISGGLFETAALGSRKKKIISDPAYELHELSGQSDRRSGFELSASFKVLLLDNYKKTIEPALTQ
jgi:hypothetical protein